MNVHHLELFYYVARYQGITEAVRNIPYGIQQPAVSGQIIALENFLGTKLFQRRPFSLTATGQELFDFIKPFFSNLETMTAKFQGGTSHQIRIGASEIVLRDHLPLFVSKVKETHPDLKLTLKEGYQPQIESWLDNDELDLGFTLISDRPSKGIESLPLMKLPLVLLVPKKSRIKTAADLLGQDKIEHALINLPANEAITGTFQKGLSDRGIDWFPSIEVSSLHLIETYVALGYGIGLFVQLPVTKYHKDVRALPLVDFPPVTFGALWKGRPTPVMQAFIDQAHARSLAVALPR
jgi:DNA-binding transcriptional LysR family regulator